MPETLIGQVPDEWHATTLGELCRIGGGDIQTGPFGSQLHASDYVPVGIPSVMPQNIGDNVIHEDGIARITEADAERLSRYLLRVGDIVYSRRGDVKRRALVRSEQDGWLCGTGCLRVRLGDSADPRFISYYLGHPEVQEWILRHSVGATMPNLNTSILSQVPVVVPPRRTQRAIAAVLGALDDKIAVNERIASTAESLSITLASEDLWNVRIPLGDLAEHVKEQVAPTSIEAARVAHYSLPAFDQGRLPEITDPGEIKSAKFRVSAAAVLLSKLNPGTPRVWNVEPDPGLPALASTEFLVLRPKFGIHPSELWAVCNQAGFRDDVANKATGTSNSHQRARPADILASHVVDPRSMRTSSREQIVSLCARAKLARIESQKLADLRDALLPGLMLGAIQVRDAEKAVEEAT